MGSYQDITKLAGLIFIRRHFLEDILEQGLDTVLAQIELQGDLTLDEKATFEACVQNPHLQQLIRDWWTAYDTERQSGAIPQVADPWEP
jgi:hypothetical protein